MVQSKLDSRVTDFEPKLIAHRTFPAISLNHNIPADIDHIALPLAMNSLPYELLNIIIDGVPDRKDLVQIRAVNKTFCALVTRCVFRHVMVQSTVKSARGFDEILGRDVIARSIEAITFLEAWRHDEGTFVRSH